MKRCSERICVKITFYILSSLIKKKISLVLLVRRLLILIVCRGFFPTKSACACLCSMACSHSGPRNPGENFIQSYHASPEFSMQIGTLGSRFREPYRHNLQDLCVNAQVGSGHVQKSSVGTVSSTELIDCWMKDFKPKWRGREESISLAMLHSFSSLSHF